MSTVTIYKAIRGTVYSTQAEKRRSSYLVERSPLFGFRTVINHYFASESFEDEQRKAVEQYSEDLKSAHERVYALEQHIDALKEQTEAVPATKDTP